MKTFSFQEVQAYDAENGTDFIERIHAACNENGIGGRGLGGFMQFRTDWTITGPRYALRQTIRYVTFSYESAAIFKAIGDILGEAFLTMSDLWDES